MSATVGSIISDNGLNDPNKTYQGQVSTKPRLSSRSSSTSQEDSYTKQLIKKGQSEGNKFCGTSYTVDGVVGPDTKKLVVQCLQLALNKDYNAGLDVDGTYGPKTESALENRYVKFQETQWLATFVQIALYIHGCDPKGVEYPGNIGYWCDAALGNYQTNAGLNSDRIATKNTIKSLCYL